MAGGVLAVYAYRRRVPGALLSLGSGTLLGAVSGLFGFLILTSLRAAEILLLHEGAKLRQTAFEAMDKIVQNTDPELHQKAQDLVLHFRNPEGFVFLILIGAVVTCLMFVFFSTLGGAIGANIARRHPK